MDEKKVTAMERNPLSPRNPGGQPVLARGWLLALLLPWAAAAGPVGPQGPIGPTGPLGPAATDRPVAPQRSAASAPAPLASSARPPAAAAEAGNRIEVSGNSASGTRCAGPGNAAVNSIDVSGARLEGRTVIVQGRNANRVRTEDCPQAPPTRQRQEQTNSIHIR